MVILITLGALFTLFFLTKKHGGPAHLAVIAGLSVYEMCGKAFASWIFSINQTLSLELLETMIFVALVALFPLLLYFRSPRGGLGGIFHIIDAAVFALVLTALLSPVLAKFFPFDGLSEKIAGIIANYEGWVVIVGIVSAYVDILIYRGHSRY